MGKTQTERDTESETETGRDREREETKIEREEEREKTHMSQSVLERIAKGGSHSSSHRISKQLQTLEAPHRCLFCCNLRLRLGN